MKQCCTCHEFKDLSLFNKRAAAWDGLQSRCRDCSREWYEINKVRHKINIRLRNDAVKVANKERMRQYLHANPCVDCGESDLRVLDFDHREDEQKLTNVGQLLGEGVAWSTILAEMKKCDVRCANCHRIITCKRANNWRQRAMVAFEKGADG